ncbi:microtubule-associated protein RP/EB family member 1B-like [Nymphaea colorata]|uniref:microtubule-associated protein RP/EB family member 1B-like n=1 Tax=Nymphaea colorata TaxID=210225 RepID=UPI00129ECE13|nr:microtubule-associated protein RP/EB family member 1B-like [Nymphaea colorata]
MNKPPATPAQPSRQQIFAWIHSLLNDVPPSLKVEELGKGSIYCRLLNHYFPGVILINRIIWAPKSEYENLINLRILQNAFLQLKIAIPFDPVRLSKEKLNDNWPFLLAFYRYLTHNCDEQYPPPLPEDPKSPPSTTRSRPP